MSTGKRLAKRSIIGTRVCAQGADYLWYSGIIQAVKTPASLRDNNNCINLTPDTKYSVRFDSKQDMTGLGYGPGQTRRLIKEYLESELIGPGFQSVINVHLRPTQKIYITYNGRESAGEVISHDVDKDEVTVKIPANGHEPPFELKKRLEEVRLLESRRSARLADQDRDTDFARLADMGGDRRRASHSIDVPLVLTQQGSRKRRPSYSSETDFYHHSIHHNDDLMDECNAALVLMSLSCSPLSPRQYATTRLASSPGGSSASSWCSGSSSPPLSDEGVVQMNTSTSPNRVRTTSLSTSDEGIGMDYNEDTPRKRMANGVMLRCMWKGCRVVHTTVNQIETHIRNVHLGPKKPRSDDNEDAFIDSDHEEEFYYTEVEDDDQDESSPSPPSPPTLSHRDMARPPHEDPEYQRQLVGSFRQGLLSFASSQKTVKPPLPMSIASTANIPTSPIAHHNYTWAHQSPMSPQKHVRLSPRPSTSYAPYPSPTYTNAIAAAQHNVHIALGTTPNNLHNGHHQLNGGVPLNLSHSAPNHHQHLQQLQQNRSPVSPHRRTRGENKKCRKVYGMDNKEAWCTQCKWKKACSRFGD